MRHLCRCLVAALALPLGALRAQEPAANLPTMQWEFTPLVGRYMPTNTLAYGVSAFGMPGRVKQEPSLAYGGRVAVWWPGRRFGIEGTVAYAPSDLLSHYSGFYPGFYQSKVVPVAVKALLRVTPPSRFAALHVGTGLSVVGHGGTGWDFSYVGPTTFVGGIVSAGVGVRLGQWTGLRFDVEDYVYAGRVGTCYRSHGGGVCDVAPVSTGADSGSTSPRLQDDLVLAVGFTLRLP